jgi:hypothetical protein
VSFEGKFEGKSGANTRILLDANSADITAGGGGRGGDVLVKNDQGQVTIRLDGGGEEGVLGIPSLGPGGAPPGAAISISASGAVVLRDAVGKYSVVTLRARKEETRGAVSTGEIALGDGAGGMPITLHAVEGTNSVIRVGGSKKTGWLSVWNGATKEIALLGGNEGVLELRDAKQQSTIALRAVQGNDASIAVGGSKRSGWIVVRNDADKDAAFLTGHEGAGTLELRDKTGNTVISLKGDGAAGFFGGLGSDGDLIVLPKEATAQDASQASVAIRGHSGDIVLRNADCAEEFDVEDATGVEGGTVLVLNDRGGLCVAHQPYDRRVAGVVSGAGGLRPGIVLGREPGATGRRPVALSGKVFCQVDATYGPIEVGDLLTTSATPGHAMTAQDSARAFGAVLGKAIAPLRAGQGLIPVLVALQ